MTSTGTWGGGITLLLAVVLGMISLRASNPWLLLIACALLAPVLISQLLRPNLRSISICFRSTDRVVVGAWSEQTFHVHNRGRRSCPALQLDHSVPGLAPVTFAVPALPPGGTARVVIVRLAFSRGLALTHDMRLSTTAPFGMAVHQRRFSASTRISVHPAPGSVGVVPNVAQGVGGGRPNRLGDEPHELREWRRGDSLRQVHWRATARHDRLTIVIPENTVRSRLAMVIHGTRDEDFEALVSTAASTALQAARSDGMLRLSAAGNPDYIGDDPGAILDWFAALGSISTTEPEPLDAARTWAGSSGSLVIATSRSTNVAELSGVLVLTPDGQVTAA